MYSDVKTVKYFFPNITRELLSSSTNSGDLSVSGDLEAECCEGWRDETCVAVLTSWIQFRLWTVDTIRSRVQVWAQGRLSVENYDI